MAEIPKEASIVKTICTHLKNRGIWFEKQHGGYFGVAGKSDLLIIYQGEPIFVEVKRPRPAGKNLTKLQRKYLMGCQRAGAYTAVARSWEEVRLILYKVDQGIMHRGDHYEKET